MEPETAHAIASFVADNTATGSTARPVSVAELEAEMEDNEFYQPSEMIYVDTVLNERAGCAVHKTIFDILTHYALRVALSRQTTRYCESGSSQRLGST